MQLYKGYYPVIGLEIHAELKTKTKMFCSCPTTFGAAPNTQTCPVCMGMPGALPTLNGHAVNLAIKAGLATDCIIANTISTDRKNYFYPDLPKAYQISQKDNPLCKSGKLAIETSNGKKTVGITRIHIEEDAGKLMHHAVHGTMLDFNRSGIPLIEVVSEPELFSAEEAVAFLRKLRTVLLYAGVSDCRMQEGSLRCDVNLSVKKEGQTALGTRTEIKNLNSFTNIRKAIEAEFRRQVDWLLDGGEVVQETRRFDPGKNQTLAMRKKENAADYRFFQEYDLPVVSVPAEQIAELRKQLPVMPDERKKVFARQFGLREYDCELLTESREMADFFVSCTKYTDSYRILANLLLGEINRILPADVTEDHFRIPHAYFAAVATMAENGTINSTTAKQLALEVWNDHIDPIAAVKKRGLAQISDVQMIQKWVEETLSELPTLAVDYKNGKTKALTALIGRAMAKSHGKANPVILRELALQAIQA